MGRYLTGGTKLSNCQRGMLGEASGLWVLVVTIHIRGWVSMGEGVHIARVWPWVLETRKKNPFLLQCLSSALYWQSLKSCPLVKEEYLKGPDRYSQDGAGQQGSACSFHSACWTGTLPLLASVLSTDGQQDSSPRFWSVQWEGGEERFLWNVHLQQNVYIVKTVLGLLFPKSRRRLERAEFSWGCCVCNQFQFQVTVCSTAQTGIYRRQNKKKKRKTKTKQQQKKGLPTGSSWSR